MKIAIVNSKFNELIVKKLLKGALQYFKEQKIDNKNVDIFEVSGAFEIPLQCQKLAKTKKYDAIITLGCIVKGKTDHYDMICRAVTDGIMRVMLDESIPIIFEVLMVHDIVEANLRSNTKNWNENMGYIAGKTAREILNYLL